MTDFQNDQLLVEDLPSLDSIAFEPVEKSYLRVRLINACIIGVVFAIIFGGLCLSDLSSEEKGPLILMIIGAVFLTLFLFSLLVAFKGFHYMGFALREKDLVFKKGWLWKSQIMIPFKRVQHCEVNQNPIERIFGLSRLKVYTAGGSSSDLSILGLKPNKAEQLKWFITNKTNHDEEE